MIYGFKREADIILNIGRRMSISERQDITRRIWISKEIAASLNSELENKLSMFKKMKKLKGITYEGMGRIRFM